MSKLPLDASDKRLHKMYQLAEYCAAFPDGCTETKMIIYAKRFGNIVPTIMRLLADMGENGVGLVTRIGTKYYVTNTNYISWGEAKGFRERFYTTKCDPGCGILYASTLPKCPACGAENTLKTNEHRGYTHTTINSIPSAVIEKATEPYTHTHENARKRVQTGKDAELRIVKFLSQFGDAELGGGQNGRPDVLFTSGRASYGVEVKSVEHQVRTKKGKIKAGSVPLTVRQWRGLCGFCEANGMVPLLVVEVRIRGSNKGPMYHFIPREIVDARVAGFKGKNLRVSVLDLPGMSIQSIRVGLPMVGGFRL